MASPGSKKLLCSPKWALGRYLSTEAGGGRRKDGFEVPRGASCVGHLSKATDLQPGPSLCVVTREGNREKTHFLCSPTRPRDSLMWLLDVKPRRRDARQINAGYF